jgi:hypothetical protein
MITLFFFCAYNDIGISARVIIAIARSGWEGPICQIRPEHHIWQAGVSSSISKLIIIYFILSARWTELAVGPRIMILSDFYFFTYIFSIERNT